MAKFNKITILSITAGLISVSAMNAVADDERTGIATRNDNYWNKELNQNVMPAWTDGTQGDVKTLFTAVTDNTALSLAVVRNNTDANFVFGTDGFEYGTYTYQFDADGNMTGINYSKLGSVGYQETSEAVTTGAFKSGDMVGVYIKDTTTGEALYSDMRYWDGTLHDGKGDNYPGHSDTYSAEWGQGVRSGESNDPAGVYSVFFDTKNLDPNILGNQYTGPYEAAIRIQVTSGVPSVTPAGGVSGGPLPGVWATIALAGAAGTYLKRRKNK